MFKSFSGRSERDIDRDRKKEKSADDATSTTSRRRKHRSERDDMSVVSRRSESDRKKRNHDKDDDSRDRKSSTRNGTERLTESAVRGLNDENDDDWEDDEELDAKSERRSKRSSKGRSDREDRERETREREKERTREYERERERDARRKSQDIKPTSKSQGKARARDDGGRDRAIPEMGSMDQFPGMYTSALVQPPEEIEHTMSGALPLDSHVPNQFPGQYPDTYAKPAFEPNPHGEAADYYGDQGQSVSFQPGIRPQAPPVNPDAHLITPSATANPVADTGSGSAADFYSGKVSPVSFQPNPVDGPGSTPGKPGRKPSKTATAAAAALTAAAVGGIASKMSNRPSSNSIPFKPSRHNSAPGFTSDGTVYGAPPAVSGRVNGTNANHTGLYAAGGAAAIGAAAYETSHHGSGNAPTTPNKQSYYGRPGEDHVHEYERRGPIERFKDGLLDLISSPEDVRKMEAYTEYIGVCKHCFDPRSSPFDGPRRHHYHPRQRDSFESLRRRASNDRLRRKQSGERIGAGSRIEKESRYGGSEYGRRQKTMSRTEMAGLGALGAGAVATGAMLWKDGKDFDDTYSIQSGHRATSAVRRRSRSSSHERRRRSSYGVIGPDRSEKDKFVIVRTKDGRTERRRVAASRSRSREKSRERRHSVRDAAAGAVLGATAFGIADRASKRGEKEKVFVRRRSKSRSRSRSSSPGGFFGDNRSRRSGRRSPKKSLHGVSRRDSREQEGLFGGFFSEPRQNERHGRQKKSGGFFSFSNDSASSAEGLAFGEEFVNRSSLGRKSSASSLRSKRKLGRRTSEERMTAAVAGIGATAAALAAAQRGQRLSRHASRPELGAKRETREVVEGHHTAAPHDEEWEDELPSDVDDASSGESALAFGDDHRRRKMSRQSMESLASRSSDDGLAAWAWRWGSKKKSRKPEQNRQSSFARPSDVPPPYAQDNYSRKPSSSSQYAPLQHVDPRPLSETGNIPGSRHASMPGAFDAFDSPPTHRPGPAPIQAPQPSKPISPAFTQDDFITSGARDSRRSQTVPKQQDGDFMQDAALIGGAALATAGIIASQSKKNKDNGNVRFGLTEEQQRKEAEARQREKERAEEEQRRSRAAKALKEEAERSRREEDERRRNEQERKARENREAEARRAREARDREFAAAAATAEQYRREQTARREAEELAERDRKRRREEQEREASRREQEDRERAASIRREKEERERRDRRDAEEKARREADERDQRNRELSYKQDQDRRRAEEERRFQEEEDRTRRRRDEQRDREEADDFDKRDRHDKKSRRKSSLSRDRKSETARAQSADGWKAPVAAGVAGALAGAVLDGARHKEARESKTGDREPREVRETEPFPAVDRYAAQTVEPTNEHSGAPITDDDIFDPDYFKRKRSQSELNRQAEAQSREADQMITDREEYYNAPQQSQAEIFAPKELLQRDPHEKERSTDPMGGNEVQVWHASEAEVREHFQHPLYAKDGPGGYRAQAFGRHNVPRLNVIAPTPPPPASPAQKPKPERDDQSTAGAERGGASKASNERRSRAVSWGEDQTHVYQVQTPESMADRDSYVGSRDIPASASSQLDEIVVEEDDEDGSSRTTRYGEKDLTKNEANREQRASRTSEPEQRRSDSERVTADRQMSNAKSSSTRSKDDDDDVETIVRDEDVEESEIFVEPRESSYRQPFYDSVSDLGFAVDSPGTEGAPPVRGWVEDEEVDDPTPAEEKRSFEQSTKRSRSEDAKTAAAAGVGVAAAIAAGAAGAAIAGKDAEISQEPAWEPPLSKKEKKKREKLAKRQSVTDDVPASDSDKPELDPVAEPSSRVDRDGDDDGFENRPLSKKEKKKRDKARRSSTFDDDVPGTPQTEEEQESSVTEPVVSREQPDDDMFLSKKDKKKRDKALKRSSTFDSDTPDVEEKQEPTTKDPVIVKDEVDDDQFLSKKERKRRDKLRRSSTFDSDSPDVDDKPEVEIAKPAAAVQEPDDDLFLSKKEKKKRQKAGKRGVSFEDESEPSTPVSEQEQSFSTEPNKRSTEDRPLTEKEKQKVGGVFNRSGLSDIVGEVMSAGGIAALVGAAKGARDEPEREAPAEDNDDIWSTPSKRDKKGKKKKKLGEPFESDPRDIEPVPADPFEASRDAPAGDNKTSMPGGWDEEETSRPVNVFDYEIKPDADEVKDSPEAADDTWNVETGKSKKKKNKRSSGLYGEPAVSSPLRAEVSREDDYIGKSRSTEEAPLTRNGDKDISSKETNGYSNGIHHDDDSTHQAEFKNDSERNPTYEKVDDRKDRARSDEPESRHRDGQSDEDYKDDQSTHSRRRSRHADDDTMSTTSSRSKRDKDEPASATKEKKGGIFGSIFGRKQSDGAPLTKTDTRDSKSSRDDEEGHEEHRRHRRRRTGSEYGDDDDSRSVTSSSSRHHRHHHEDEDEHRHRRHRDDDDPGERRHHRHRSSEYDGPEDDSKDQSFLGDRVEDLPPLPDSRPASPISASEEEGRESGKSRSAEIAAAGLVSTAAAVALGAASSHPEELPPLPDSPPASSPMEHHPRIGIPIRPSTSTSVPLRFRPPPASPQAHSRSGSLGSPVEISSSSPAVTPRQRPRGRTGDVHSGEYKPLYLAERHSQPAEPIDDDLPSLPSSKPSSRASSVHDSEDYHSAVEDVFSSPMSDRQLRVNTDVALQHDNQEDLLDSQQTTPRAGTFEGEEDDSSAKSLPQFYTWEDLMREQYQNSQRAEQQLSTEHTRERQVLNDDNELEHLPALPESRPETPANVDAAKIGAAVAAGATVGALAATAHDVTADKHVEHDLQPGVHESAILAPRNESTPAFEDKDVPTVASDKEVTTTEREQAFEAPISPMLSRKQSKKAAKKAKRASTVDQLDSPTGQQTSDAQSGEPKADELAVVDRDGLPAHPETKPEPEPEPTLKPMPVRAISEVAEQPATTSESEDFWSVPVKKGKRAKKSKKSKSTQDNWFDDDAAAEAVPQTTQPEPFIAAERELELGQASAAIPSTDIEDIQNRVSADAFLHAEEAAEAGQIVHTHEDVEQPFLTSARDDGFFETEREVESGLLPQPYSAQDAHESSILHERIAAERFLHDEAELEAGNVRAASPISEREAEGGIEPIEAEHATQPVEEVLQPEQSTADERIQRSPRPDQKTRDTSPAPALLTRKQSKKAKKKQKSQAALSWEDDAQDPVVQSNDVEQISHHDQEPQVQLDDTVVPEEPEAVATEATASTEKDNQDDLAEFAPVTKKGKKGKKAKKQQQKLDLWSDSADQPESTSVQEDHARTIDQPIHTKLPTKDDVAMHDQHHTDEAVPSLGQESAAKQEEHSEISHDKEQHTALIDDRIHQETNLTPSHEAVLPEANVPLPDEGMEDNWAADTLSEAPATTQQKAEADEAVVGEAMPDELERQQTSIDEAMPVFSLKPSKKDKKKAKKAALQANNQESQTDLSAADEPKQDTKPAIIGGAVAAAAALVAGTAVHEAKQEDVWEELPKKQTKKDKRKAKKAAANAMFEDIDSPSPGTPMSESTTFEPVAATDLQHDQTANRVHDLERTSHHEPTKKTFPDDDIVLRDAQNIELPGDNAEDWWQPAPSASDTHVKSVEPQNQHIDIEPERQVDVPVDTSSVRPRESDRQGGHEHTRDTATESKGPKPDDDLDFAATLAAGLAGSGFDPDLVIHDPAYHRRSSPPARFAEADLDETQFQPSVRRKRSSREQSPESADLAKEIVPEQAQESSTTRNQDLDDAISRGLEASGFDAALLHSSGDNSHNVSSNEVNDDQEEFSWATTRRKKSKKGKKASQTIVQDEPSEQREQAAAVIPDTWDQTGEVQSHAPLDESIDRKTSPQREDQKREEFEEAKTAIPRPTLPEESAADEWSVPVKTKGKKGKKGKKAVVEQTDADADSMSITAEKSMPSETTISTDIAEPATPSGAAELMGGDREMDIDEMDKAYKAYKKNKRRAKKEKYAVSSSSVPSTPMQLDELVREDDRDKDTATRDQQTDPLPATSAFQHDIHDMAQASEKSDAMNPERAFIPQATVQHEPEASGHRDSKGRREADERDRYTDYPRDRQSDDLAQQRPNEDTLARHNKSIDRDTHRASEAAGLVAAGTVAAIGMENLTQHARGRSISPEIQDHPSRRDHAAEPSPSWSFAALDDPPTEHRGDRSTEDTSDTRRDYDHQSSSRSHDHEPNQHERGLQDTASRDSLNGRKSLHIDTDKDVDFGIRLPKQRGDEASQPHTEAPRSRTPSGETPLEPTSRNRASYLFQPTPLTTPENKAVQDVASPRTSSSQRSRHIDVAETEEPSRFSPSPSQDNGLHNRLNTIIEESGANKRGRTASPAHQRDAKALRTAEHDNEPVITHHFDEPRQLRHQSRDISRHVSSPPPVTESDPRRIALKRVYSDQRSPSVLSNHSIGSNGMHRMPEELRSFSRASSGSSQAPILRRTSLSGDLRAASRASSRRGDGSIVGLRSSPKTIPFEPPPTPPLYDEDVVEPGASRAVDMADVYVSKNDASMNLTDSLQQGYGDQQGSHISPTRPPSVRKRQSMHILDLESRLDQLTAENRALAAARESHDQHGANDLHRVLEDRELELREKDAELNRIRAMLGPMQDELDRLTDINQQLVEANRNVVDDSNSRYAALEADHAHAHEQWQASTRELDDMREHHTNLASNVKDAVGVQLAAALAEKDQEIRKTREELEIATERIRALQVQIQTMKTSDFLVQRDEDYFDGACQKLCQHVQQWILRFSKYSDNRMARLSADVKDEKIEARLDNAILDGSDVDKLLANRTQRRDVFMSVVTTMIWEYIFTRYLFGMDREQRQKLKTLEKTLAEVGPPRAVAQWRATTLTLLSQRPTFAEQCEQDTEAVTQEIFAVLCALLPPPSNVEKQLLESLQRVIKIAVDLSIEMRTQRAEFIMLPPLQPEYDTNGELVRKMHFNAQLMNERSGAYASNEQLDNERAVVKLVLFPPVVKKGDNFGEGAGEIVVCPAQVLVHNEGKGKKVVRVMSGAMDIDDARMSRQSLISTAPGNSAI